MYHVILLSGFASETKAELTLVMRTFSIKRLRLVIFLTWYPSTLQNRIACWVEVVCRCGMGFATPKDRQRWSWMGRQDVL